MFGNPETLDDVDQPGEDPPATPRRVPFVAALKVAAATSVLFLLLYSGTAMITQWRAETFPGSVPTWYYGWERWIPFMPIMIVPYMSIDAFFVLAPFLCRSEKELRILGWRLTAVVVIAAICFLLYPLELAVERPHATGFFGSIYNWFIAMDRPYNLCPSMHIALRTVLAVHYGKHTRGWVRLAMNVWFFLIGCSTLLLYQHHVIDVVGGFVLAFLVMYVIDGLPWRQSKRGGAKFAWLYGLASALFLVPIAAKPTLGWWLAWPGLAAALVAFGYAWAGPAVYRRRDGKLTWPARMVLGPVLAAQWLSWKYYGRQADAMNHVCDGVYLGRQMTEREASQVVASETQSGTITAVIDVCNAFSEPDSLRRLHRLQLPILDLTAPTNTQVDQAVAFIERHRGQGVLVHCKAGYSRSAALVAAWLVRTRRVANADEAFQRIRSVRPSIVVRPEIQQLPLSEVSHA